MYNSQKNEFGGRHIVYARTRKVRRWSRYCCSVYHSFQLAVGIQALQGRADVFASRNHLGTCLAPPILLVVKGAVVLLWKAVKQTEDETCIAENIATLNSSTGSLVKPYPSLHIHNSRFFFRSSNKLLLWHWRFQQKSSALALLQSGVTYYIEFGCCSAELANSF